MHKNRRPKHLQYAVRILPSEVDDCEHLMDYQDNKKQMFDTRQEFFKLSIKGMRVHLVHRKMETIDKIM